MHAQRTGTNAHQALSFDHDETNRAPAGAQLEHVPINPAQLESPLVIWARQGRAGEKRDEVKQRILKCHRAGADQLDLQHLSICTVPDCIGKLTNLQRLDLYGNQLSTLPKSIGKLTKLQTLHLGSNRLITLPKSIRKLTNLQTLLLFGNRLTTLPEVIVKLTNLQDLGLGINPGITLPESIGKLTKLQDLGLGNSQLTTLPKSIWKLRNLQRLALYGNELTTLPESIEKLTKLESLNLNRNRLTTPLESVEKLTNLQSLDLGDNYLTTLPKSVEKLTNLRTLYLAENQLNTLPESIEKLTNLQRLRLDNNQLTTLPESIEKLINLQSLYLAENQLSTLPESISKLTGLEELSISNNPLGYLPSALAGFQRQHDELKELPLRDPAPSEANQSQRMPNIGPAELEALRALQDLPPDLNRALADLKNIDSMGEQLHAVAQAQRGMVRLSALPKRLASIPQCAQFYQVALKLLLRSWFAHEFVASQVMKAEPRPWVTAIQALFKAAPVPGLSLAGFGFAALVNQIDTVMKANKGQLLLDRFNNSKVMFEQVAHTVASRCTVLLESELSALPENNDGEKRIGLGKQLKALYNECEALAQRLKLQAKPLVNPRHPAANKADELMSLLLNKLCAQTVDEGRARAMPQAHENNFVERMSNYCVELLLPTASNTLVVGRKLLGHKAFALAPNGGSSQGRAASPPRSISPNSFARAMAEKDAAIAKLEQRLTDLQAKAEAASTLAETADRNASEAKQQISIVGLSKQSAQQIQHNVGRLVLTQSSHGTQAAQSSMGFQPGMGIGQHPNDLKTLNERVDILDHKVAELRQFDLLDTPLSALEYGRVVAAYLQEHGRLHSDGTVDLNNKQGGFKNRKLLEKLKDIHNVENRDGDYKLCIELPALLKKMSKAAYMNPRIPRNTLKLQELLDAEKTGLQKPCPKGETASGNSDINSERSQLLGLGNRF